MRMFQGGLAMHKSKLITVGLAAMIALATGGLIIQHNELVAQAEQSVARSYELKTQKEALQARTERLQARTEQLSAANSATPREIQLASQAELPDLVVSAPRFSGQGR
jgi:uncharacterized protein YlxW (UPF0749 family)